MFNRQDSTPPDTRTVTGYLESALPGKEMGILRSIEHDSEVSAAGRPYTLIVDMSDLTEAQFVLREGENIIGRLEGCDVMLSYPPISRKHAVISIRNGKVYLQDLGSKNRTYIENKAIDGEVEIRRGTAVHFGFIRTVLR